MTVNDPGLIDAYPRATREQIAAAETAAHFEYEQELKRSEDEDAADIAYGEALERALGDYR